MIYDNDVSNKDVAHSHFRETGVLLESFVDSRFWTDYNRRF